jgi:hypothetical protein
MILEIGRVPTIIRKIRVGSVFDKEDLKPYYTPGPTS